MAGGQDSVSVLLGGDLGMVVYPHHVSRMAGTATQMPAGDDGFLGVNSHALFIW